MIKKKNGFTLMEIILVIGIMSVLATGVYGIAAKRNATFQAEKQAQYVGEITDSLTDYLMSTQTTDVVSIDNVVSDTGSLIAQKIIPPEMAATPFSLQTIWGTPVFITAVVAPVNGFQISLTNIPEEVCTKFTTQASLLKKAQGISVNGTVVKTPGVSDTDVGVVASSCVNAGNTVNISVEAYKFGIDPIVSSNAAAANRNKENKYYIAPTGTATSTGAATCSGGSYFDPTYSACVCAPGSKWSGKACVAFGSAAVNQAGTCNIGQMWNQVSKTCQAVCPAGQVYNQTYQLNNPATNGCVANAEIPPKTICIPGDTTTTSCQVVPNRYAPVAVYDAGRYIPDNVFTPVAPLNPSIPTNTNHTAQIGTSMPTTFALAGAPACPPGVRPTSAAIPSNANGGTATNPIANFDGKVCNMCVNGTWDGDRCVTK